MYPTEVRTAIGSLRMSCPSTSAVPSEGVRTVARIRRVVVLPAPLGPRNPKTSPLGTSKSTPLSASTELRNPAYRLLRPWTRMAQVVAAHLPPRRLAADRGDQAPPNNKCSVHRESPHSSRGPRRLPVHGRRESTIAEPAPLSCPSVNHADCDGDSLVSIPDRDFGHARDLGDFLLRTRLVAENRGNVDRGRGHPTRRYAGREFVLLDLVENLLRLPLDVHVQLEAVAEPGDVVPRTLRQKLEPQFADEGPIRPSDRLAVHAGL